MDRSEQSKSLYFPESIIKEKNTALNLLLDVGCNLSKFICLMIPEITRVCKEIKKAKRHWKMYNWKIDIELKEAYKDVDFD